MPYRLRRAVEIYYSAVAGLLFELYDLFQAGYISAGLTAAGIFHAGAQSDFVITDSATFASATFLGLFLLPMAFLLQAE